MKKAVNVHDAKTHFSKLLARVEKGEEVLIARAGTPVAKLVPNLPQTREPVFGADRGAFTVPDDFDSPLPEAIVSAFEGQSVKLDR